MLIQMLMVEIILESKPVGSLEEGSDNILSANNTEHFLSVENASETKIMFLL